jgi:DNA helicase II / ATP-dependent DNA helicase PcrA
MAWDDDLVGIAKSIAAIDRTPLRVMAGPGTGKSFAMKRRVARLLEAGQNPKRILAVTFTRTAAASLVNDLRGLDVPGCESIGAGTLHAYCFGLLNSQQVFDYLDRVARPIITFLRAGVLQFEGNAMLDDLVIAGEFGSKRACTKRIRAFEAAWARLQSDDPGWPNDPVDKAFQAALAGWLRFHRAMLIGELVPEALRYLRHNPECEARSAYDHVIIDEYQDLNRAEQDLIQLLSGGRGIALVGDVDQSIYRFRHANPDGIRTYKERYPETHDEVLDECRRCPTRVVAIANYLIEQNYPGHHAPRLRPRQANVAGEIHIVQWHDINEEAVGLAEYVGTLVTNGVRPGEILILTPRRLLGYELRDQIRKRGIAVHSFYHEEALEEDDAQRTYCLLSLLVDPEDRVALRWWLAHCSPSGRRNAYHVARSRMSLMLSPIASSTSKRSSRSSALASRWAQPLVRLMPRNVARTSSERVGLGSPRASCPLEIEATWRTRVVTANASARAARYAATVSMDAGIEPPHRSNSARSLRYALRVFGARLSRINMATPSGSSTAQLIALTSGMSKPAIVGLDN